MDGVASYIATVAVSFALGLATAALVGRCTGGTDRTETTKTVTTDTVAYRMPVPIDSTVIRYDTIRLPAIRDTIRDSLLFTDTLFHDSVNVTIPIAQKEYKDSLYDAWVSGWNPRLDSIRVYSKTILETTTNRTSRWGIGISAGYGIGTKGLSPYIGVGVVYRIWDIGKRKQ